MPARFGLSYTGADNAEHTPVMIHRAMFGSYERFIGILIEHYAGELPLWLAPLQALVLPVSDRFNDYAAQRRRRAARRRRCASSVDDRIGVGRAQDPRGGAAQGSLHADRGRARAGVADGLGALAQRRRRRRERRRGASLRT